MRLQVVNELIDSEERYVSDLQTLIKVILHFPAKMRWELSDSKVIVKPVEEKNLIPKEDADQLFGNIEQLLKINSDLLRVSLVSRSDSHSITNTNLSHAIPTRICRLFGG